MVLESWVIIVIMAVAAYMFARAHRKGWSLRVLPLMVGPLCNIVFSPFARRITQAGGDAHPARILVYVAAAAVTAVWVFFCARHLRPPAARAAYILCSLAFTVIVLAIFYIKLG